ncbi:hypothetical protein L2K20_29095 [Mycobacterium sp. MBM]|nr:hypothetical protein [Mycobacterium sp. MBM]
MSTTVVGYLLIWVGIICVLVSVVLVVKKEFSKMNQPVSHEGLPEEFFKVVIALVKAPPAIFLGGLGLVLIGFGMFMIGTGALSGVTDCFSAAVVNPVLDGVRASS